MVYAAADNSITHLREQNIASGFGFLQESAGFGVNQALIPYSEESSYARLLLVGLLNTLLVSLLGIIFATILGFVIGITRLSSNWLAARLAGAYVEIVRNIPLLLQIFFWYFAFLAGFPPPRRAESFMDAVYLHNRGVVFPAPHFEEGAAALLIAVALGALFAFIAMRAAKRKRERTGQATPTLSMSLAGFFLPIVAVLLFVGNPISWDVPELTGFNFEGGLVISRELAALFLALSIYTAAYIAEIVRAGILAVHRGQVEAARALGLKKGQTLRFVTIPQAMQVVIPPLTNQYLNLTKNSSLAAAIAYPEIVSVFAGTALNQTGQAIEIIFITMCIYLSISVTTAIVMNSYNARVSKMKIAR